MCQLASISSRMRRLVALSSTTSTRRPSSAAGCWRRGRTPAVRALELAVKWNVLPRPYLALDPQTSTHQLDDAGAQSRVRAGSTVTPRRRAVGLRECLKDLLLLLRRMPIPVSLISKWSGPGPSSPSRAHAEHDFTRRW